MYQVKLQKNLDLLNILHQNYPAGARTYKSLLAAAGSHWNHNSPSPPPPPPPPPSPPPPSSPSLCPKKTPNGPIWLKKSQKWQP